MRYACRVFTAGPGVAVMNLLATVASGQPEAAGSERKELADFLETQRPMLRAFLRKRLNNGEDVDDAVQETCLRLLHYQARSGIGSPSALMYHVAENVVRDVLRRAQTHRLDAHCSLEAVEHQLPSDARSPERIALADQQLQQVIAALGRLPPGCRRVFLLSRAHGLNYPQIAARCGISVKMVEKQISRALSSLRERVGGWPGAAP